MWRVGCGLGRHGHELYLYPFYGLNKILFLKFFRFIFSLLFYCGGGSEPWMHVLCTVGGAWAIHKWMAVKEQLLVDINEIRYYKGLPPVVGTHYFFPLVPPDLKTAEELKQDAKK